MQTSQTEAPSDEQEEVETFEFPSLYDWTIRDLQRLCSICWVYTHNDEESVRAHDAAGLYGAVRALGGEVRARLARTGVERAAKALEN